MAKKAIRKPAKIVKPKKPTVFFRGQRQGDPGFDPSKDQVVVTNADGSESTVLRKDVK